MLYPDVLLPFTAITLKRLDLSSEGAQQLHCEVPISFPPKERFRFLLAAQRGDDSGMRCHHLCRQHPLDFVLGADTRTAANTSLMTRSLGGFSQLPSHAALTMP